jgi:hypothetical protein
MAYPLNESFEAGIPAGFALPGGSGGVTATWNEAEQAVDLSFQQNQCFWIIHAAQAADDFWFEFEFESLQRTYDTVAAGAWFWAGEGYSGHRLIAWKQIWHHCWWAANGSQYEQVELEPALWAVIGARRTVRFDVKRIAFDVWMMQITDNGEVVWRDYKRGYTSLRPCIYGYGLTMRVFRVVGDTPSALPDPPADATPRLLPSILGHRILDLPTAQATHYNARGFTKLLGIRNHYYHGNHRITGTVKEKTVPNDRPVSRRVFLFDERRHVLVRETWSDPVTGAYSFDEINPEPRYVVIAYDYKHNFRAVIADNLHAEPMPS